MLFGGLHHLGHAAFKRISICIHREIHYIYRQIHSKLLITGIAVIVLRYCVQVAGVVATDLNMELLFSLILL